MENLNITPEYLSKRPLSYSSLKAFRKSPKHYIQYLTEPFEATDAMILGKAVDCLTLEPEQFEKRFEVYEKFDKRTNEAKLRWSIMNDLAKENKQTLLNRDQYELALKCKDSLMSHKQSRELIEGITKTQLKLNWTDTKTNIPLIGYADFESTAWDELFVVDLKTCQDAEPDKFSRQALDLDYMIQCGAYLDAYHKIWYKFPSFIFLAVETKEPFNVSVNFCDDRYISIAKNEFHSTLEAFKKCMDENRFNEGYEYNPNKEDNFSLMKIPGYFKPKYSID
jgi:exodeoxyribonuclease VIII